MLAGLTDDAAQAHWVFTRQLDDGSTATTSASAEPAPEVDEKPAVAPINSETGEGRTITLSGPLVPQAVQPVGPAPIDESNINAGPACEIRGICNARHLR